MFPWSSLSKWILTNLSYPQASKYFPSIKIVLQWSWETHWHQVEAEFRRNDQTLIIIVTSEMPPHYTIKRSCVHSGWDRHKGHTIDIHVNYVAKCQELCKQVSIKDNIWLLTHGLNGEFHWISLIGAPEQAACGRDRNWVVMAPVISDVPFGASCREIFRWSLGMDK